MIDANELPITWAENRIKELENVNKNCGKFNAQKRKHIKEIMDILLRYRHLALFVLKVSENYAAGFWNKKKSWQL